jgi:hypothetical protein
MTGEGAAGTAPATLVEFYAARLDEDEAAAKAAGGGIHCREWDAAGPGYQEGRVEDGHGDVVVYDEGAPTLAQAKHIARHDPARVLREVAAKRAILGAYESQRAAQFYDPAVVDELRDVIETLASVYSDHPDYRPKWNG